MDNVKLWELLRAKVVHEDTWIQNRVNWILASNTILLGGFATLLSTGLQGDPYEASRILRDAILLAIPVAGGALNTFGFVGLFAAWKAIAAAQEDWLRLSRAEATQPALPRLHSEGTSSRIAEYSSYMLAAFVLLFWATMFVLAVTSLALRSPKG
ncbi:MAG TPA: hypothetical protein VI729_13000 [Anaerolineales bacterium]|nr:hypothetical protein [Anaerolineales bacterium]